MRIASVTASPGPYQSSRCRRWARGVLVAVVIGAAGVQYLFPGNNTLIAFAIATGVGGDVLQERIDALEAKAIRKAPLTDVERIFLRDFYSTLATGGKLTLVAYQTGEMMHHYLSRSGVPLRLDPSIFTENAKVQAQAAKLRARASCDSAMTLSSPVFYMPDRSKLDSVFGLYHGQIHITPKHQSDGRCELHWRAEVPWVWPSYESLKRKYGNHHAESFPLPNLLSIIRGPAYALYVDNGLGHHLEEIGLAKSFVAYSEWVEP
jgi:hypothetical protein